MKIRDFKKLQPILFASALAFSPAALASECPQLVWSDEFQGSSVDFTNNWEAQIGDGCAEGICGWGNNELQYYKAENATVSNGTLKITAKRERVQSKAYTSARLRTKNMPNSGEWQHGRFEARIKLPFGAGLWPAFWMLPSNTNVGWPLSGEIDIMESTGQASMIAMGHLHYGEEWPNNSWTGGSILSQPGMWSDGFHTYAMEWEPNEMRWYVDDIHYLTLTPDDLDNSSWWTFEDYEYHFLINVAVGGSLGGPVDNSIFPVAMEVDYVRVYDNGRPAVKGPNIVAPNEVASYSVIGQTGNTSYNWSVNNGATISGSGESVSIDFSGADGVTIVSVDVSDSCGNRQLTVPVFVEPSLGVETVWDDFSGNQELNYTEITGDFNVSNGLLTYTRNDEEQWDVIIADTNAIPDAGPFIAGEKAFRMDLYNTDNRLVGKEILVQLENSSVATPNNYPSGRHSKYEAFVEHANGWQTLRFRLQERIDGMTSDTSVDSVVFLIDPSNFTGDTYVFDLFAVLGGDNGGSEPPPDDDATTTIVASVTTGTQNAGGGNRYGVATVTVTDNLGNPVAGANVTGTFSGSWNETHTEATNSNGVASFQTSTTRRGGVTVNFCVNDVTNTTLPFDSDASTDMCN
jgi:beta-glucanase (GH16 family)